MLAVEFRDFFGDLLRIPALQKMLGRFPGPVAPALQRLSAEATAAVFLISEAPERARDPGAGHAPRSLTLAGAAAADRGAEEVDAFASSGRGVPPDGGHRDDG